MMAVMQENENAKKEGEKVVCHVCRPLGAWKPSPPSPENVRLPCLFFPKKSAESQNL